MPKPAKKSASPKPSRNGKFTPVPNAAAKVARPGTKSAVIMHLLSRDNGATLKELAAAANWQEHSIRGFISGTLKKKHGLELTSQIVDGKRHYSVNNTGAGR